jgi:hypothetical protein
MGCSLREKRLLHGVSEMRWSEFGVAPFGEHSISGHDAHAEGVSMPRSKPAYPPEFNAEAVRDGGDEIAAVSAGGSGGMRGQQLRVTGRARQRFGWWRTCQSEREKDTMRRTGYASCASTERRRSSLRAAAAL